MDIKLEPTPKRYVALTYRRVQPFLWAWSKMEKPDLLFLLASVYVQDMRDAETVQAYTEKRKADEQLHEKTPEVDR